MSKLKMHSPDLTAANIDKLAALFPNCITESRDDQGQLRKAVDFDLLRQEFADAIVEGPVERYSLNWPGKREAIVAANTPVYKTLRPCEAESVDFDTTKNLYIEGDNLEVLKLLQETYLGKVKMIYIDPPYNTGNDFIYDDDFAEDVAADLLKSSQKDASGGRLVANFESNGRFHSDWLSMMCPRIKLARDLLREDGIIFISVDDHEAHNLRKICDESLGASNFLACFVVIRSEGGGLAKHAVIGHDYLVAYAKNINCFRPLNRPKDIRGEIIEIDGEAYWIEEDWLRKEFGKYGTCPYKEIEKYLGGNKKLEIEKGLIDGKYRLIEKKGQTFVGRLRKISEDGSKFYTVLKHLNKNGTADLESLELSQYFSFPKPISLLRELVLGSTFHSKQKEDLVLDFFSGSATTAHAVMQLNAEDGGNRRFIMVQLPEVCDEKSEAYKAGYKNICEIGKERIRRAGQKIKEENATNAPNLDVGFRVFKLDSSNMKDVYYTPDATEQSKLDLFADAIKEDRTAEDLLFQVFLDCGLDLALPIAKEKVGGKTVFVVDQNVLIACFAADIPESLIRTLAQRKPLKAVFLDRSFAKDSTKLNVTQVFKQLAPGTEVKTI